MYLFKIYVDYNYKICDNGLKETVKNIYNTINILNSMSPSKTKYFGEKKGNTRHSFGLYKNGPHGIINGYIPEGFTKIGIKKSGITEYNGNVAKLFDYFTSDLFESKQSKVTIYRKVICDKDPNITFYYVVKRISNNKGFVKTKEAFNKFVYAAHEFICRMKDTDTGEQSVEIDFI